MKTFVLSDESVNSHGFKVNTEGINLDFFNKNPLMLYMHKRSNGIIGRWENVRKEGGKLLGDAVFDEGEELGEKVKKRVDNGFLHACSIGIDAGTITMKNIGGIDTVIKCDLIEVSIVDMPANKNAVKLAKCNLIKLHKIDVNQEFKKNITEILGLTENAINEDILSELKRILNSKENIKLSKWNDKLKHYKSIELIDEKEYKIFSKLDQSNVTQLLNDRLDKHSKEIDEVICNAIKSCKIVPQDKMFLYELSKKIGLNDLKKTISMIPDRIILSDLINMSMDANRNSWSLNEYRKYAPNELRDNPELYDSLIRNEKYKKESLSLDLDWYRKNDPEYLKKNPKEYQRLLNLKK